MTLPLVAQASPLRLDDDGVLRIGKTRVTLETLVAAFKRGATAETIADQYPAVSLSEIYLVIGYYLEHRMEVDDYIRQQHDQAAEVRRENEARFDPAGVRTRLLARRQTR